MTEYEAYLKAKCPNCPLWHLRPEVRARDKYLKDRLQGFLYGWRIVVLHNTAIDFNGKRTIPKLYGISLKSCCIDEIII